MDTIKKGWKREFFQVPNEIYDRRDVNGYAKAVFIYLCRLADESSQAFPSYARIAQDVGFSQSTVRRAISELSDTGLLLKKKRCDRRGLQVSNLYILVRPSDVPERGPGCSKGTGRVFCENKQDVPGEQIECSVRTGRVSCENNEKDPDQKDIDQKDLESVSQSVTSYYEDTEPHGLDGPTDADPPSDQEVEFCDKKGGAEEQLGLIVEKAALGCTEKEAIKTVLEYMYFSPDFAKKAKCSQQEVRAKMRQLTPEVLAYTLEKTRQRTARGQNIRNAKNYLATAILNAVSEAEEAKLDKNLFKGLFAKNQSGGGRLKENHHVSEKYRDIYLAQP